MVNVSARPARSLRPGATVRPVPPGAFGRPARREPRSAATPRRRARSASESCRPRPAAVAVHQSVASSSARAAMARSSRSASSRGSLPGSARSGRPNVTWVVPGRMRRGALGAGCRGCPRRGPARSGGPCGRPATPPRPGGAGPSRRGCARPRGRSAGSSRRASRRGDPVGRVAAHPLAFDRHGVEQEGEGRGLEPGCRRSSRRRRPRTCWCRHRSGMTDRSSGVSRWLAWLAAKITGSSRWAMRSRPVHLG